MSRPVFTIEERDRVRNGLLEMARNDPRLVAGAIVGSMARGGGDRWSDLDLTFGLADGTAVIDVLIGWTRDLEQKFNAVHLFDLPFLSTIYRVFLFPGNLQVDLSFTPIADFGALGPDFQLIFGQTVERLHIPPPSDQYLFGLAVHHAVRARFCIARGRLWQAEYWISEVRDQALSLACLRYGLEPRNGRGYDGLPVEITRRFTDALVRSIDCEELLRALGCSIEALLGESTEVREFASKVEAQLYGLLSTKWPEA